VIARPQSSEAKHWVELALRHEYEDPSVRMSADVKQIAEQQRLHLQKQVTMLSSVCTQIEILDS
jgi:hypothetical protein